jgi:orotate phosphoribosyltransferase
MPSLTSNQVLDLFRRVGALLEGHFKLSSGLHSPGYLQSALVLQHPREAETLGAALADAARPLKPDVVMSPALGGIVIGQEVARALDVPAFFAERQDGTLTLRRGFSLTPGARVFVGRRTW